MSVKLSIKGIPQARAFLKLKKGIINNQTKKSMSKIGLHMQNEVKLSIGGHKAEPTSVDTGHFMGSVDFEAQPKGVTIFSMVPYAKFLEWGTSRLPARMHFNNSLNRNKQKVISILKGGINI